MRHILFVLSTVLFMSCQNVDDVQLKNVEEKVVALDTSCVKCDKTIIDSLILHTDWSMTAKEIHQFLCSLDSSCDWSEVIKPFEYGYVDPLGNTIKAMSSEGSYNEWAREILIVGFYHNFSKHMEIFEADKNLNRDYIFSWMIHEEEGDLPYTGILDSLNSYSPNTEVKRQLVQIFENNIERFQR